MRHDRERRLVVVVKRAQRLVVLAGFLQRKSRVDHLDDVHPRYQIVDEGLGNTTHALYWRAQARHARGLRFILALPA